MVDRIEADDIAVEYEILLPETTRYQAEIDTLDAEINGLQDQLNQLNIELDRLMDSTDGLDHAVAFCSGMLAGIIDIVWVGNFDFQRGKAWSNQTVNEFVTKMAKKQGYTGNRLDGAIQFLEEKFKIPSDNVWKGTGEHISAKSHHLDDFSHHPTPIGLMCSILTQFTKKAHFSNADGTLINIDVVDGELVGQNVPNKIFAGTVNWFFHLVSDMSGSHKTAGVGMGIPGPIVSVLKEISAAPGINQTTLPRYMKDLFVKEKFDLRSELAVGHELKRQAMPVILNEVIVRSFYFIRRLSRELKRTGDVRAVEWEKVLPVHNRTIVRMVTIATGTFATADLLDAAIRSVAKARGKISAALPMFLLRVNFVGLGRFVVAVVNDVRMGFQENKLLNEQTYLLFKQLYLKDAKIYYRHAEMFYQEVRVHETEKDMWIAARDADEAIANAETEMAAMRQLFMQSWQDRECALKQIGTYTSGLEKHNPRLIDDMLKELQ